MTVFIVNALLALITLISPDALQTLDTGSLAAWADPEDQREAIYLHAPPGACAVSLDDTVITILLCEDTTD